MPANLTPDYSRAEEQYKQAKTPEEKLQALELMMANIPKHKGTEKMQADIKRRISKLKKGEGKKSGKQTFSYHVEKQGASQVIIIGPPNAGKSSLINAVTNANLAVGEFPFTTRIMQPAMMPFENLQIQLIDTPAFHPDYYERWVLGLIRVADVALLMLDLGSPDLLDQMETTIKIIKEGRVELISDFPPEDDTEYGICKKKTLLVANKTDLPQASDHLDILKEFFPDRFGIIPVSAKTGAGIEDFKRILFENLGIIRVFTKAPGKKPDYNHPFILKTKQTVADLAVSIHKDLARNMKYARIWGEGYYEGQSVDRHQVLKDGDVIEIHD
ncbi:MAG: 50S ribosome-binding GTPase [Firmicutes bacterium]|nr:50S ribosome-binding GTPase [Bacillota bacterium]